MDSAETLFFKFGYRKITVEEICAAAGVSKMTFYRYFTNKTNLIRTIITEISEEGLLIYRRIMDSDIPFNEKVRESIRMKMDMGGRFSEEFLMDVYRDQEPEIVSYIKKMTVDSLAMMMDDYRKAQQAGYLRADLNLELLPYILNQMTAMVKDPALLALYKGNMHEILRDLINLFFYGILTVKENEA